MNAEDRALVALYGVMRELDLQGRHEAADGVHELYNTLVRLKELMRVFEKSSAR